MGTPCTDPSIEGFAGEERKKSGDDVAGICELFCDALLALGVP